MNKFLSSLADGLEPYVPGEQPKVKKYIKLNTNESPYGPSPKVLEVIKIQATEDLRLYPDPKSTVLLKAASDFYDLPEEMIFAGNGSDEVLAFAFAAFYSGKKLVFPEVTYSFYPVYCNLFDIEYEEIPMGKNLVINTYLMKSAGCGIVFPNPNAPTGEMIELDNIRAILESNPDNVVLVDEAYIDFGGISCIKLVEEYENLLVVQTFSKSRSLAGMRIGLAFGSKQLIDGLNRVKNSFNSYPLDRLAQYAGVAALEDNEYYIEMQSKIVTTREKTVTELERMGFGILNSCANFIFASHNKVQAVDIYQKLKDNNVLVRYFNKPGIENYVRITIGTDKQMKILFQNLEKILEG
ncbi:MAG: histidinol-phosphate transaminase [Clostridiales bacterium]|nr:histidinol-phosphate transaminase [Clostridiales bacterium]